MKSFYLSLLLLPTVLSGLFREASAQGFIYRYERARGHWKECWEYSYRYDSAIGGAKTPFYQQEYRRFDRKGRQVEGREWQEEEGKTRYWNGKYDGRGRLVAWRWTFADGELISLGYHDYDSLDRLTATRTYHPPASQVRRNRAEPEVDPLLRDEVWEYRYEGRNPDPCMMLQWSYSDVTGELLTRSEQFLTYNSKGDMIQLYNTRDGEINKWVCHFTYDSSREVILRRGFDIAGEEPEEAEWYYRRYDLTRPDASGNWRWGWEYISGEKPVRLVERQIHYYKSKRAERRAERRFRKNMPPLLI